MSRIDRGRPEPLYHQLEVLLRGKILTKEWPPGTRIPTEKELCDTYHVSRVTVRQAVRNLVESGFLTRTPGRGTFVKAPLLTAGERALRSFSEDMRGLNLKPGSTLMDFLLREATQLELERLELAGGAKIFQISRLRTGDGHPIGLQVTRLPETRFPDLEAADIANGSLYELLETRYGVQLSEAHERFWATNVQAEDAAILDVAPGAPAFRVERVSWDNLGPMEFTTSLMRGDRYQIQWVLKGRQASRGDPEASGDTS